ncbi:HD-GYP domain-containing protein [Savagea faecisuis]|uniref:HD-GYP domain-containing protein n=1 Tax=Savagea faecisuis TaxID=1274803 RepID=A0ABW3GUD1_9BACL
MEAEIKVVSELEVGDIIEEDVFANTKFPIVKKGTLVTDVQINVLKQFDIVQVLVRVIEEDEIVEVRPAVRKEKSPTQDMEVKRFIEEVIQEEEHEHEDDFQIVYRESYQNYKMEYDRLRSGSKVNVPHTRQIIIPLIEMFFESENTIYDLKRKIIVEDYIYHHHLRTSIVATLLAKELGYSKAEQNQISLAALLMDAGMAKISMTLLNKTRDLTEQERMEIRKHVIHSYTSIQNSPILKPEIKTAIVQHHERMDGSGYPLQSKYQEIHQISQILAVADVFCALTEKRPYRSDLSEVEAIEYMRYEQYGKYDLKVIEQLQKLVGFVTIGTQVELNNKAIGVVVHENKDNIYRPIVKVDDEVIDLKEKMYYMKAVL